MFCTCGIRWRGVGCRGVPRGEGKALAGRGAAGVQSGKVLAWRSCASVFACVSPLHLIRSMPAIAPWRRIRSVCCVYWSHRFVTNKATGDSMFTNIVGFVVDFLQVLSFIIPPSFGGLAAEDQASATAFGWDRSFWWLGDLAATFRIIPPIRTHSVALNSVFYIVLCAVIFMVVNAGKKARVFCRYFQIFCGDFPSRRTERRRNFSVFLVCETFRLRRLNKKQ
jgi:hypothetical protein